MVGGEVAYFEAAKPVLNAFGSTIARAGPSGAGQVVKAANQLVVAGALGIVTAAARDAGVAIPLGARAAPASG
jgi:2-hydroxy-3-oxopropionate reductase